MINNNTHETNHQKSNHIHQQSTRQNVPAHRRPAARLSRQSVGFHNAGANQQLVRRLPDGDGHRSVLSLRRDRPAEADQTLDAGANAVLHVDERHHTQHAALPANGSDVVHPSVPQAQIDGRSVGRAAGDRAESAVRSTAADVAPRLQPFGQLRCVRAAGHAVQSESGPDHRAGALRDDRSDAAASVATAGAERVQPDARAGDQLLHRLHDNLSGELMRD